MRLHGDVFGGDPDDLAVFPTGNWIAGALVVQQGVTNCGIHSGINRLPVHHDLLDVPAGGLSLGV